MNRNVVVHLYYNETNAMTGNLRKLSCLEKLVRSLHVNLFIAGLDLLNHCAAAA